MKTVYLIPHWESWANDRLFQHAEGCVYTKAFKLWKQRAAEQGFLLSAPASPPTERPDVLWFIDLPKDKCVFQHWINHWSHRPRTVLHIMESPLLFPHAFHPANRSCFDAVVSYETSSSTSPWFHCPLPVELNTESLPDLPFEQRKLAVMINTNRYEGWLATRKPGLTGLPGIGRMFSGWSIPTRAWMHPAQGELYSWRRRIARDFATDCPGGLDLFGEGWNGERVSWCPWINRRAYPNANSCIPYDSKRHLLASKRHLLVQYRFVLASENYTGNKGYISEKIFDALLAGSVPVYWGDHQITNVVPRGCFVDVRAFSSNHQLINFLKTISNQEWQDMRRKSQEFLNSSAFSAFSENAFSDRMNRILGDLV